MKRSATFFHIGLLFLLLLVSPAMGAVDKPLAGAYPRPLESYADGSLGIGEKLIGRIRQEPFNLLASALFLGAILHTFIAPRFMAIAHRYQRAWEEMEGKDVDDIQARRRDRLQFRAQVFHFMGEVEAVFGIWVVPLAFALVIFKGWPVMVHALAQASYTEPVFVVVVMAMAASRPILRLAEQCLARVADLGGGGPMAWWLSILTVGPLLGSFITEPAAMTICALLLVPRFYHAKPGMALRYATLGLLFVNVSVGGTLTHFAAPPVVMVAQKWGWDLPHMLTHFGWKSALGIIAANGVHFLIFRRELSGMSVVATAVSGTERPVPLVVTATHLIFIGWTVLTSHDVPLVILGFLFFLAFVEATERHQTPIQLRSPLMVGFFLAALVVHGGGQQWWIEPVLGNLSRWPLLLGSTLLTAFNDNAAITYLASLVPSLSEELKYAVMAGAVAGGGLTVIANAPNPAGQAILQGQFGEEGISPLKLFFGALAPTLIVGVALAFLP